jgi:DNA-directed RNA polymerase subunit RPC12/RpoP
VKKRCLSCGVQFALSGSGKRQKYCPKCAKRGMVRGRGLPASKLLKRKGAKLASDADLGSFVVAQIEAAKDQPVSFTTPEGDRVRVYLSGCEDRKGDELYWSVNLKGLKRLEQKRCGFSDPREAPADIIGTEGCSHIPLTRRKPDRLARDP